MLMIVAFVLFVGSMIVRSLIRPSLSEENPLHLRTPRVEAAPAVGGARKFRAVRVVAPRLGLRLAVVGLRALAREPFVAVEHSRKRRARENVLFSR